MINNMSLGDLGLTLDPSNNLTVDSTTLNTVLTDNYSGVVSLFESTLASTSSVIQPSGTDYSSYAGSFALGVTTDASGKISGISINGTATSSFTYSGSTISGVYGTPYFGMVFSYTGSAVSTTTTATITATQGLANQIYTTSNNFGNTLNGTVESLVTSLQDEDSSYQSQYNTIINEANDYATFLLQQYASLSTQIASASYTTTVLNDMFAMQTKG
jgi:flagellar hook-associated protein 2